MAPAWRATVVADLARKSFNHQDSGTLLGTLGFQGCHLLQVSCHHWEYSVAGAGQLSRSFGCACEERVAGLKGLSFDVGVAWLRWGLLERTRM
jgi:hypothetical protein